MSITNAAARIVSLVNYAFPATTTAGIVRDDVNIQRAGPVWEDTTVASIDIAAGTFKLNTFRWPATPTGARLSGSYLPLTEVAEASGFTLETARDLAPTRTYATDAVNGGWETYAPTARSHRITFNGVLLTDGGAVSLTAVPETFIFLIQLGADAQYRGQGRVSRETRAGGVDALQTIEIEIPGDGPPALIT